jgi:predicted SAM-dependent methyltransferase
MKLTDKENEFTLVTDENFDEQAYLASNPDAAKAVGEGRIESGKLHFELFGRKEKRKVRVRHLSRGLPKLLLRIANTGVAFIRKARSFFLNPRKGLGNPSGCEDAQLNDLYVKRQSVAQEYIAGAGIEIGALHHPLPVPKNATVSYVDRMNVEQLRQQYPELNQLPLVDVDILADGETLESINDFSQDFVIANHFLEHCQNPLLAIENMLRVLKQNGVLFMAIPDKRYTFDIARPVTTYQHLENDYINGGEFSKKQHFEEWVKLVNKVTDESEATKQVNTLISMDYSIHFHVWTQIEMVEIILNLKHKVDFEVELICRNGNEVIFVLRKG